MAGQYIVPILGAPCILCVVAIALSNTNQIPSAPENIKTPVLVVWGERDTSLGPNAASNLRKLPNSRLNSSYQCVHIPEQYHCVISFHNIIIQVSKQTIFLVFHIEKN